MRASGVLVLVLLLPLAGCIEPAAYRLAVSNVGSDPTTVAVTVFHGVGASERPVAGQTFDRVPPNTTSHVDIELRPARTYRIDASTLDLSRNATAEFRAQRGTWWLTVFIERDGRLTIEPIREE